MDTTTILVIVLAVSVAGHLVSGYFNYKILAMVLRAITPSLRHRAEPMPQLRSPYHHATDRLEDELQGLQS
jgi:hypothetical protein